MKITTLQIASHLNRTHKGIIQLVNDYENNFKELGCLEQLPKIKTGGRPIKSYNLNIQQLKYLISLMHGNEISKIKLEIVKDTFDYNAFYNAKVDKYYTYIYIVKNNNDLCKIGLSKNPKKRIRNISTQTGQEINIVYISDKLYDGNNVESRIHGLYSNKRKLGEWFELDNKCINDIIRFIESKMETSEGIN